MRVILQLIYDTEKEWDQLDTKARNLDILKSYFGWMKFFDAEERFLKNLAHLEFNITPTMSLRQLLDIGVPLERFLNIAVKDEGMFQVRSEDRQPDEPKEKVPLVFVLDHLRSAFNVGSLFRLAEGLGIQHVYLIGYTPTPEDDGVKKTAMGSQQWVSWSQHHHADEVLETLHKEAFHNVALETTEQSQSLMEKTFSEKVALWVGNERFGLDSEFLEKIEDCVEIPMLGHKNSLNVANALSIVSFEVLRQWKSNG
ncbi:MAG: TrmH family RNA methyltransferase [Pseudomonadota bacterium]